MNILYLPGLRSQTVEINDQDQTLAATYYYGFQSIEGKWIILRQDNSLDPIIAYRYAAVTNNSTYVTYATAWAARATLSYDYFVKIKP